MTWDIDNMRSGAVVELLPHFHHHPPLIEGLGIKLALLMNLLCIVEPESDLAVVDFDIVLQQAPVVNSGIH